MTYQFHRNNRAARSSEVSSEVMPLITVGITCFNASATIERALESALSQDWPNIEVLIVDDGSTDGSREILARRALTEARLRVIEHPVNCGCAAARNTLIEAAKGEFLAFFDDDDVSESDRLRLQHNHTVTYESKANVNLVACYSSGRRVYPNGYIMPIRAVGSDGLPPIGHVMADYLLFNKRYQDVFYGAGTPTCSLMARTEVFRALGGFDIKMRRQEDVDFAIRLAFKGGHFIGIPNSVLIQNATGGDEKAARIEFESFLQLLEKNADYLHATNNYTYMRMWSELRYLHFSGQDTQALLLLMRLLFTYPFRTMRHFLRSASRRFFHERRMNS